MADPNRIHSMIYDLLTQVQQTQAQTVASLMEQNQQLVQELIQHRRKKRKNMTSKTSLTTDGEVENGSISENGDGDVGVVKKEDFAEDQTITEPFVDPVVYYPDNQKLTVKQRHFINNIYTQYQEYISMNPNTRFGNFIDHDDLTKFASQQFLSDCKLLATAKNINYLISAASEINNNNNDNDAAADNNGANVDVFSNPMLIHYNKTLHCPLNLEIIRMICKFIKLYESTIKPSLKKAPSFLQYLSQEMNLENLTKLTNRDVSSMNNQLLRYRCSIKKYCRLSAVNFAPNKPFVKWFEAIAIEYLSSKPLVDQLNEMPEQEVEIDDEEDSGTVGVHVKEEKEEEQEEDEKLVNKEEQLQQPQIEFDDQIPESFDLDDDNSSSSSSESDSDSDSDSDSENEEEKVKRRQICKTEMDAKRRRIIVS